MNLTTIHRRFWAISLRELLLGVALFGAAFVSLKYANEWAWVGLAGAMIVLVMRTMIVAAVGGGTRRAWAVGFLIAAGVYFALLLASSITHGPQHELDPYSGSLPTSRVLRPVFETVSKVEYTAFVKGVTQRFPTEAEAYSALGLPPPTAGSRSFGGIGIGYWETPNRADFFAIAHLWWAALFGYCGGRFARYVYVRRAEE